MNDYDGHFCLVPVFFGTSLPALVAYHLERDGMPLHLSVGRNC